MRMLLAGVALAVAGIAQAGDGATATPRATDVAIPTVESNAAATAWVAEYRLRDARGERALVLVRTADRIEYRIAGEPIRDWRRGPDGLQHREVFLDAGRVVSYAPGDLRALGRAPDWEQLGGLVDPALRARLTPAGDIPVDAAVTTEPTARTAQRYRGGAAAAGVELDWLDVASLPLAYRNGTAPDSLTLVLRRLQRRPVADAFTNSRGLREIDYADIGDMELDPFARRYILQGAGTAAISD